ncbi:DNA cytosine methyltransferase [Chitinophaga niabensis]|uniref:DNA cytosine methyltransferase n=1 Tax=Chitinophaga niabensis TaxID=536979 RepID=UPI0031BB0168
MPKKNSHITVTDQFCGAGGSSQGANNAGKKIGGGVEVKLALNHWALAIETHNTNFPNTLHDCTDISASDPRRYPSTTILITSPECTNHSVANGKKKAKKQLDLFTTGKLDPAAERSRATMWDVPRFAEYHGYEAIIVENVVDARKWILFDTWLKTMHALNYQHRCIYLNSMHCYPTPQSRDRMYIVFWKKGNRAPLLDYTPTAHCPKCSKEVKAVQTWKKHGVRFGKYRDQYVYCCPVDGMIVEPYYHAVFNIIDWSDLGVRIGDRKKALCKNTIKRINHGLTKYEKIYTSGVPPFIIKTENTQNEDNVRLFNEVLQTQTTWQTMGLVTPMGVNGFLAGYYNGSHCVKHITEEMGSVTTVDSHALVTYQYPILEDCYYRMLKPHEIKLGMAFDPDYIVLGSGKDQVRQLGNAVTPPAMEWLVGQVIESLK